MTEPTVDKVIVTKETYKPGDVLERSGGGKIAKVVSISYHQRTHEFNGYNCVYISNEGSREQTGLLNLTSLEVPYERGGWRLRKVMDAAPVEATSVDSSTPDPELTATATLIKHLQARVATLEWQHGEFDNLKRDLDNADALVATLEERVEKLTEQRDEAIGELSAANDRAIELSDVDDYEDRAEEIANAQILTEQLAEARAELAELKSGQTTRPTDDVLTPPQQEICVMRDITQFQFTEKINTSWTPIHMQFTQDTEDPLHDRLNVVFVKTMSSAPVEPRRSNIALVGPQITIIPDEPTNRADRDLADVLLAGAQAYRHALANSPVHAPRPLHISTEQE